MAQPDAVRISHVLWNAATFNPKKRCEVPAMDFNDLLRNVERLFELLEARGIDYALVGGVAMLSYVEGRNTEVLDLLMEKATLAKLPELEVIGRDRFFVRARFGELQIDVLLSTNALFDLVRREYTARRRFAEREVVCATVEGLLLLKLYALPSLYRQGNFARVGLYENDVATLLYHYAPDIDALLGILSNHLSAGDVAEVRGILGEIEQRLQRFRRSGGEA